MSTITQFGGHKIVYLQQQGDFQRAINGKIGISRHGMKFVLKKIITNCATGGHKKNWKSKQLPTADEQYLKVVFIWKSEKRRKIQQRPHMEPQS